MNGVSSDPAISAVDARLREAVALHRRGELSAAQAIYEEILRAQPRHAACLHLLGVIAAVSGCLEKALDLIGRAIAINPNDPAAYNNRGSALYQLRRFDAALEDLERAAALNPRYADPHYNRGNVLKDTKQWQQALVSYDRAIALEPNRADALCNRGIVLMALQRHEAALASFDRAISLNPAFADAYYNRGNALYESHRFEHAVASYDRAVVLRGDHAEAHCNLGFALAQLQRFDPAIASWRRASALKPSLEFLRGEIFFARLRLCDWSDWAAEVAELTARIERDEPVCSPFTVLAWSGCPAVQRRAAEIWVRHKCPSDSSLPPIACPEHDRIRVGYFSADFHDHATAILIAGLFELHDRARFDVVGFSYGPDSAGPMRTRLAAACDRFIDVRGRSDVEVAALARDLGVDIAVDLKGFTQGSRMGIFAARAAPVQISYLGYPGTSGAAYMDYVIADRTLVRPQDRAEYTERIVHLPGSYQVNDSRRELPEAIFSRGELGLPEGRFVFCCFNNSFKITPRAFDSWMRILQRVDHGVLWLLEDNPTAARNLRRHAAERGVDSDRLIFAARMGLREHLARHRAADLFLDTAPYNAHTTASDALWTGLPVLTCAGETFASRVAASLLFAAGIPELITSSPEEFEDLAADIAHDRARLELLRRRLDATRFAEPLFDTRLFARRIEAAYSEIHTRRRANLPAADIVLEQA